MLRAVKELAFGSVSESCSVLVLHSVQIRLLERYPKFSSIRSTLQKYGCTQVLDSQASSTLPSYMRKSPVANPMMVSEYSGSRVQVDAVTHCVGRECGFDVCTCLRLGRLGCCWWRGGRRWRRQGRSVKRSGTGYVDHDLPKLTLNCLPSAQDVFSFLSGSTRP